MHVVFMLDHKIANNIRQNLAAGVGGRLLFLIQEVCNSLY